MSIKVRVKPEQFVRLWLEAYRNGAKVNWIAETMEVSEATVHRLANNCRKNGVKLPNLRRPFTERIDVHAMNKMISEQLNKKI